MKITRAAEITEQLNHAHTADSSGRSVLAQKYRDRAQHIIDVETTELEERIAWADSGIDVELDLSELIEQFDEYDANSLIEKITTSD